MPPKTSPNETLVAHRVPPPKTYRVRTEDLGGIVAKTQRGTVSPGHQGARDNFPVKTKEKYPIPVQKKSLSSSKLEGSTFWEFAVAFFKSALNCISAKACQVMPCASSGLSASCPTRNQHTFIKSSTVTRFPPGVSCPRQGMPPSTAAKNAASESLCQNCFLLAILQPPVTSARPPRSARLLPERELFIDYLLVRILFVIEIILVDRPRAMGV